MERDIFSYYDGKKTIKCDPMKIEIMYRRVTKSVDIESIMKNFVGPEWLGDPGKIKEENVSDDAINYAMDRRDEATLELIPVICQTFSLKTIDNDPENGMTYSEIIDVYNSWLDFQLNVKKNMNSSAGSPPPMEVQSQQTTTNDNSDTIGTLTPPPGFAPSL